MISEIASIEDLDQYIKQSAPFPHRFYNTVVKGMNTGLVAVAILLQGQGLIFKALWNKVEDDDWTKVHNILTDNDFIPVSDVYVK